MLAIGAHPDDIEFGCGASLATVGTRRRRTSSSLVLTDGSKGTWDPACDLAALVAARQEEQRAAARTLGAAGVHFVGAVDGELTADRGTIERVCAVIRAARPDVVLGHDPWKRYRLHPDHRRAGELLDRGHRRAPATRTSSPARASPTGRRASSCSRPRTSTTSRWSTMPRSTPRSPRCCATAANGVSTMGIEEDGPDTDAQRAAFEARIRGEVAMAGGEEFKLIVELWTREGAPEGGPFRLDWDTD